MTSFALRRAVAIAAALTALATGCASTFSAERIDDIATSCRAGIADGRINPRSSPNLGIPVQPRPAGEPVVIYGASWCAACAAAKAYMARRAIPFVERDVEEDPSAARARDAALASVGLGQTKSLPVIDVRGTVTIGFQPCVIEKVWGGG
jgi:glutaredoxin